MKFLPFAIAAVTPFDKEGDFDVTSVPGLIRYYIDVAKAPGLLICGSTGEQHVLSIPERLELYRVARDAAGPDYPLYAGVSGLRTKDAIVLAKGAAENNYQAIMLGFSPYRIPLQEQALEYARAVCSVVPETFVFVYNNPKRTGFDLEANTFVKMVEAIPNIYGIKEVDASHVPAILEKTNRKVEIISGFDVSLVGDFKLGYSTLTSIAANIFPKKLSAIMQHMAAGRDDLALTEMVSVREAMTFMTLNSILPCIKYILRKRGVSAGYAPLPLCDPPEAVCQQLDAFVEESA